VARCESGATFTSPFLEKKARKAMKWFMILLGAVLCLATTKAQADDQPALGITMVDSPGGTVSAGVTISSVVAGGPAAQAGVLPGDQITAVNNQPVANSDGMAKIIAASGANKQVTLNVTRGAWRASLPATLAAWGQVFPAPAATATTATATPSYYYPNDCGCSSGQYYGSGGSTRGWYRVGNVIINGRRWGDIGYRYSHADLIRW
jgi:membrane-associated protease RseP (regulator of RpoE activity)